MHQKQARKCMLFVLDCVVNGDYIALQNFLENNFADFQIKVGVKIQSFFTATSAITVSV